MSMFSDLLGTTRKTGPIYGQINSQIQNEQSGTGWQDAFGKSAGAFLQNAMPQFQKSLQLTREDGIRRGISTGDLGTSTEGDLTSAFQRNIANALSGQAAGMYNASQGRLDDLLSGELGARTSEDNSNRNFWGSLLGAGVQAYGLRGAGGAAGGAAAAAVV